MTCIPFSPEDVATEVFAELAAACREWNFLPTFRHGLLLTGARRAAPEDAGVAALRRLTHQEVICFAVSAEDFDHAMAAMADSPRLREEAAAEEPVPRAPAAWVSQGRSPREMAVDLVHFAHAARASDLLLDDQEAWMDVAVQIDGRKEMLPPLERALGARVLKAFKEMAGIGTQGQPAPQTGAASFSLPAGARVDMRVEIISTVHGETLVGRLQDRDRQLGRMAMLPFADPAQRAVVAGCLARRQGLLLATGPTGHGKTTTLYACLGQLDRSLLNIRTLEDPVEFIVPWITQIPVGAGTGRDFGGSLKSLLRQAPHVILMGEIRDAAAALTCVEAADTGHLLLATLHTRDAIGCVSRLLDLGLSGRQIAAALSLVIAQRLVRRLCPLCRLPVAPSADQARHFERHALPVPAAVWRPGGCRRCGGRGEIGRVPIFELLHPGSAEELAERIGRATTGTFDERALRALWRKNGGSPLVREGLRLVAQGEVAHAEVLPYETGTF